MTETQYLDHKTSGESHSFVWAIAGQLGVPTPTPVCERCLSGNRYHWHTPCQYIACAHCDSWAVGGETLVRHVMMHPHAGPWLHLRCAIDSGYFAEWLNDGSHRSTPKAHPSRYKRPSQRTTRTESVGLKAALEAPRFRASISPRLVAELIDPEYKDRYDAELRYSERDVIDDVVDRARKKLFPTNKTARRAGLMTPLEQLELVDPDAPHSERRTKKVATKAALATAKAQHTESAA